MGEALHEWSHGSTNSWDTGLLPQATLRIPGYRLPVVEVYWQHSTVLKLLVYSTIVLLVAFWAQHQLQHLSERGCRNADSDLAGDISSPSEDSDEDSACGDLKFDDRQTSPGASGAEERVSRSCEDEASGGAAAAAAGAAADDKDDDSSSTCSNRAAGKDCEEHRMEGQGDSNSGADISSPSQDSDEDSACGDLKFDDRQTSPGIHDESLPLSDVASTQVPGTGVTEEGVSGSCEDEASGDATAAAPEAAVDDEDGVSDSNCGHLVHDFARNDQESTVNNAESTRAEPHDAQAAAGEAAEKHKVERPGRAKWMGQLAGLLETAGKKLTGVAGKSDVAANPTPEEAAGETAASSSKAPQPQEGRRHYTKLALGHWNSPHYRKLGKPYDFPHLKALNYIELRKELMNFAESMGNLCAPHSEPFRATVKADCDIRFVGIVTLHIEVTEEDMENQSSLGQFRRRVVSENPFSRRVPERFTRDLLALIEELSLTVSEHAQRAGMPYGRTEFYSTVLEKPATAACTGKVSLKIFGIKADAEDSADRDGEQGEPKTDAPIQPGNRASGSFANELVDPVPTL